MIFIDDERLERSPAKDAWNSQFDPKLALKKDVTFWLDDKYKSFKTLQNANGRGAKRQIPTYPPAIDLEPQYQWFNPLTKELHMIRYVSTENPGKDAKTKSGMQTIGRFNPVSIGFDGSGGNPNEKFGEGKISGGFLICKKDNISFYQWLITHPKNKSNKKYWKAEKEGMFSENLEAMAEVNNSFEFYEDNATRIAADKNAVRKLATKAQGKVDDMDDDQKRELYAAFGQNNADMEDINIIDLYLSEEAKTDPAGFLKRIVDPATGLESLIVRAKELKVIAIDKRTKNWVFTEAHNGGGAICSITPGKDAVVELIKWLQLKDVNSEVKNAIEQGIESAKVVA